MSTKIQIIKRLEIIKNLIELEDEDSIHTQIEKLKLENASELDEIITILENDDYENINKAVDDYINGYKNAQLTSHQKEVYDAVLASVEDILKNYSKDKEKSEWMNFLSLSGSAGVGKTFVTSKLVEEFLKRGYKILLTTPTHKSLSVAKYMINSNNIHVNAKTLQSYLNLKLHTNYLDGTKVFKRDMKKKNLDYEKDLDILIVDESSMISSNLLNFISENLKQNKLKSVLFIGDKYQLPPVDEGINGIVKLPKQYKLTQIVRQAKDSYIKIIANDIKNCIKDKNYKALIEIFDKSKMPKLEIFYDEKSFLDDFTKNPSWWKEKSVLISYTNKHVDDQNRLIRFRYWKEQGITPTDAIVDGELLVFNDSYGNKFQNSEIVTVSKSEKMFDEYIKINYWQCLDQMGRAFKVVDPDEKLKYSNYLENIRDIAVNIPTYEREKRSTVWRHYFATKDKYADVKYIFASTIHKVQGSTYDTAYINASTMASMIARGDTDIAYRLLYVAVTRASKDIKILF